MRYVLILLSVALSVQTIRAQAEPEKLELIFPTVATQFLGSCCLDPRFETSFTFLSLTNTSQQASFQIFQNDGSVVTRLPFGSDIKITTDPLTLDLIFQPTIPPPPFPDINGWARVLLPSQSQFHAQAEVRLVTDFAWNLSTAFHLPAVRPARTFQTFFANRVIASTGQKRQTAFAIVNPSSTQTAHVKLTGSISKQSCSAELRIPALNRISRFVEEMFACDLRDRTSLLAVGSIAIVSDIPIAVGAVDVLLPELRISTLPVVPKED